MTSVFGELSPLEAARGAGILGGGFAVMLLCGCILAPATPSTAEPAAKGRIMVETADQRVTLTGVRASQGNAVDCPELRTDDGELHPVVGLTAEIALGDRVTVTGRMGVSTTCRGEALIIEELTRVKT